jgi:hypothetical protein
MGLRAGVVAVAWGKCCYFCKESNPGIQLIAPPYTDSDIPVHKFSLNLGRLQAEINTTDNRSVCSQSY